MRESVEDLKRKAELLIKTTDKLIKLLFGGNLNVVLVLCADANPDSIAIMSDLTDRETMLAILANASNPARLDEMVDAYPTKKAH